MSDLERLFTSHAPTEEQKAKYEKLRTRGLLLALAIEECCPPCADRSAAIRKVREAVMTANAAIACALPSTESGDGKKVETA